MKSNIKYYLFLIYCVYHIDCVSFRCDYTYHTGQGWFKYHAIPLTWKDAELMCHLESPTGILASPTEPEIKAIMQHYISMGTLHTFLGSRGKTDIFTGIHSTFSKGHYYSIDGIPLAEISHTWADSEPDNKNNEESCLSMDRKGKLSDVKCDEPRPYICYRPITNEDVSFCGSTDKGYNYKSQTNKCYKLHVKPRTFSGAHFACSAEGGHLAIINSMSEASILRDIFSRYKDEYIIGNGRKDVAFVGFHNWHEGGDWRTIHGQRIGEAGYALFERGTPNNNITGENCGSIMRSGFLSDLNCEEDYAFFCEKDPNYPALCSIYDEPESSTDMMM